MLGGIDRWSGARCGSWLISLFYEAVDEAAGARPNGGPLRQHLSPLIGDAVVAAGRPGVRRNDAAGEQIGGGHGAEHRINGALFEDRSTLVGAGQTFGDFITVQVLG